ncbi:MAG: exodeoxyribonuclease V subunit gamma, partial [Victivallales bacterium]|nr:exodeoxyribonuclease V subunit gamma [Victivallales bacterium]
MLANYATQAKEFFKAIVDMVPDFGGDLAILEETAEQTPQTLLGAIQEQIVNNENPSEPMELREEDDSLVVYNCFNATREVEALRDALLLLLKRHPNDYTLNDIIVMAPDIAAFAPAIRAVFDNCELRGQYSLSDRSIRQANLLAEGFLEILRLPASRFEASRVTQLLDSQPLRNRFDFSEEDVTTIRQWMATAQIRLDYDLKDRQKRNSHMDDEAYTWQLGLDRMLLSLAVDTTIDSEKRTLGFAELEPLPFTEEGMGDANRTLGHFCAFLRKLHETAQELTAVSERTAVEWRDLLLDILQRFFRADADSALDHYTLRSCINALATDATSGGYTGKLPFSIVQTILEGTLEGAQPKAPFLEGKITCCSMMPMREVPCKVLAMLGMDAGSFPHRDASTGFTLLRRGSPLPYYVRSRIQEDQYIFLEAIQSVREHLLIFYHGQDDKNPDASAAKLSPAPVVEELLAYAENACQLSNGGDVRKELVVKRNLNSFDAKNFRPKTERQEELSLRSSFSFDQVSHAIAMTAEGESSGEEIWKSYYALPMLAEYPVREAEGGLQLELTDWEQFFKNPMRFFLQRRLNYGKRSDESDELEDSERFAVTSPLEKWSIRTTIFNQILLPETPDVELVERRLRRASQLPLGDLGSQAMRELRKSVKLPDELNSLALWRNQTPQEFSVETEVPSDLFEGLPELAKLRPVGMGCRLNALRERVPVRLHGSFPVAELNGACGIAMVCHSKCVEKNGLVPQYILAPYLHWLVLAANEDGRFPFVKFLDTKEGQLIDFLSEELIARQDLAEYARGRLAQLAQLYLLGHFIPLPLCLNSNAKESMTLIYGCNDLKGIREMQAGIQEVQNVLWAS